MEFELGIDGNIDIVVENRSKKKKNSHPIKISHPNWFRNWCDERGMLNRDGKITCECICKALKSEDTELRKRANFAYNFGFKRNGKICKCVEEITKKKSKH